MIFLLTSNIFNLGDTIKAVQKSDKLVFVQVDLVDGISANKMGVKYICEVFKPDGIITTKNHLIKACED
ncbi:MAG: glycerol-3-phosphate responsive antiterminator [Clostridiales bacterium]|nr:glycerol-3-phosphate responsive antiterminator [Clostridiales bacterium]